MKVLIIGGTGFIGSILTKAFVDKNWEVSVLTRQKLNTKPTHSNPSYINLDWEDNEFLKRSCLGKDLMIYCAGLDKRSSNSNSSNADVVHNKLALKLAHIASEAGIKKYIYLSTAHVYGSNLSGLVDELSEPIAEDAYGLSHLNGERNLKDALKNTQTELVCLRLSNCFGVSNPIGICGEEPIINNFCREIVRSGRTPALTNPSLERDFLPAEIFKDRVFDILKNWDSLDYVINVGLGFSIRLDQIIEIIHRRYNSVILNHDIDYQEKFEDIMVNKHHCNLRYSTKSELYECGIKINEVIAEVDRLLVMLKSTMTQNSER
jgi:UDP-glucose 4-epimerase